MTVVHIGAKPLGAQGDSKGYHVNYLDRSATLAYPNVKLVSTDGSAVVKLNSALLASASNILRLILREADFTEDFSTVVTEVGKAHLLLFAQFVTTGTVPVTSLDPETVSAFQNLGVHLDQMKLETSFQIKKEMCEETPTNNGDTKHELSKTVNFPQLEEGDDPFFEDGLAWTDSGCGGEGGRGDLKGRDDRGMPCSTTDLFFFPSVGDRDLSMSYQCPICVRGFPQEYMFKQHLYRHEASGPEQAWACDICDGAARFPTVKQLLNHKRQKHKDMCTVQLRVLDYALRMHSPKKPKDKKPYNSKHPPPSSPPPPVDDDSDYEPAAKVAKRKPRKKPVVAVVEPEYSDFDSEDDSLNHKKRKRRVRLRDKAGELKCDRCGFSSNKDVAYRNHMLRHEAEDLQKEPISFFCKLCHTTFVKGKELKNHMESSHPGDTYIFCTKCSKEFDTKEALTAHMKVHQMHHESAFRITVTDEVEGTYDAWFCKECKDKGIDVRFRTREEWNSHRKEEHTKHKANAHMEWECGDCDEKFYSKGANELVDHRIKEHPAGGLICQYCGKDFTLKKHGPEDRSRINLIQHMRKHKYGTWGSQNIDKKCVCCGEHFTQQMRFSYHMKKFNPKYHNNACPICEGVRFDTYEEHKAHNDAFHNGHFVSRCNDCPAYFDTDELRDAHKAEMHPSEKVICPVCAKSIAKSNMTLHHKTYHGSKVHQCDQCPKSFSHITAFNHHYRSHQKVSCHQCGLMVSERQMERHIKSAHTRSEDKPFQCTICQPCKGFLEKTHLEEHMNIHLGKKPFRCELGCPDVAYANRGNLAAHVRSVHKGIKRNYSRRNR